MLLTPVWRITSSGVDSLYQGYVYLKNQSPISSPLSFLRTASKTNVEELGSMSTKIRKICQSISPEDFSEDLDPAKIHAMCQGMHQTITDIDRTSPYTMTYKTTVLDFKDSVDRTKEENVDLGEEDQKNMAVAHFLSRVKSLDHPKVEVLATILEFGNQSMFLGGLKVLLNKVKSDAEIKATGYEIIATTQKMAPMSVVFEIDDDKAVLRVSRHLVLLGQDKSDEMHKLGLPLLTVEYIIDLTQQNGKELNFAAIAPKMSVIFQE